MGKFTFSSLDSSSHSRLCLSYGPNSPFPSHKKFSQENIGLRKIKANRNLLLFTLTRKSYRSKKNKIYGPVRPESAPDILNLGRMLSNICSSKCVCNLPALALSWRQHFAEFGPLDIVQHSWSSSCPRNPLFQSGSCGHGR